MAYDLSKGIALGCLAPPLAEQLASLKTPVPADTLARWQIQSNAISTVSIGGLIPHSVGQKAYAKLAKNIAAECERLFVAANQNSTGEA